MKLVREYIELPPKTRQQILSDIKQAWTVFDYADKNKSIIKLLNKIKIWP